jgi:prepilin-type N-terminal cleavage/methylation domain-containing protein
MHTQPPHRPSRRPARAVALRDQAGFTIIEVLIAAVILALVAAGSAVALVGAVGTSGIQRNSSAAEALAQQDESRLRGYTVSQLANLNQSLSPVTLDGTQYTVHESASFVSDSSGTPSCTNPSADYLETTSSVTWAGMPSSLNPVTVTGLITPTYGEISSSSGVLAVQVQDPSGNPIAGMPVSVSGPGTASGVTASNGCVLFGDLPVGNSYTVAVTPASGSYVDAGTGQAVNSGAPDTQSNVQVSAGTTAASPTPFVLATPGTATFSFTDAWPTGVSPSPAPTATAPSVVLSSGGLTIICSAQDTSGCPATGQGDTSWAASAWNGTNGQITAQPLVPATYATYAGICASDNPSSYGGSAATTSVTAGGSTTTTLTVPSIVVRLYSGTTTVPGSEIVMPAASKLVVTDTQCDGGEHFVGGPGVTVPVNDSALPINSSPVLNGGTRDTGLLGYPGMPYGKYTVCYQSGTKDSVASITNQGTGEIVKIYNGSLTTGSCAT